LLFIYLLQQRLTATFNNYAWAFSAANVCMIRDLRDDQLTPEHSSARAPAGF
jgi:hypothetical protein